jgi:hypothetical protein
MNSLEDHKHPKQVKKHSEVIAELEDWQDNVNNWIEENSKTISGLEDWKENVNYRARKQQQEITRLQDTHNRTFKICKRESSVTLLDSDKSYWLDDFRVCINGEPRAISTVYSRRKEIVSYRVFTDMIDFTT